MTHDTVAGVLQHYSHLGVDFLNTGLRKGRVKDTEQFCTTTVMTHIDLDDMLMYTHQVLQDYGKPEKMMYGFHIFTRNMNHKSYNSICNRDHICRIWSNHKECTQYAKKYLFSVCVY